MALPEFFVAGAPKAGTTALHAALAGHPQLFLPPGRQPHIKEPKFYLCDDRRPPRSAHRGPGDAHSRREWVWRRSDYEAAFAAAPPGTLRGESTPFYLYDRRAKQAIARDVPHARLIAVLRDPVERAYSNWMHLRSDGLEPIADFAQAWQAEDERVAAGWAPFWHYRQLGRYGEQLEHLYSLFPREQVLVLRYRELVDDPASTLDAVCDFLGVDQGLIDSIPRENSRPYVPDSPRTRRLARVARAGAALGSLAPPNWWRVASRPLLRSLQRDGAVRPALEPAVRLRLAQDLADDVHLLERLTGRSFADWLGESSRGQYIDLTVLEDGPAGPAGRKPVTRPSAAP